MNKIKAADEFDKPEENVISGNFEIPGNTEACIQNICHGKEFITREEAFEMLAHLAGVLAFDHKFRERQAQRKKYLRET